MVPGTTYYYKLEDLDTGGVGAFHGPVSAVPTPPKNIYLPLILHHSQGRVPGSEEKPQKGLLDRLWPIVLILQQSLPLLIMLGFPALLIAVSPGSRHERRGYSHHTPIETRHPD